MNLEFDEEQGILRQTVREFAEAEIAPHSMEWDEAQRFCDWLTKKEIAEQKLPQGAKYRLPSDELTDEFVKLAAKNSMVGIKGYRTVGGIRASIYNAMPVEGCQALANFMKDFASKKS